MGVRIDDFATLVALEPHGPDVVVGLSPDYPWGRVYGGQVGTIQPPSTSASR